MSTELIGILTLGVALAALRLGTLRGLRTEMRSDLGGVRSELHGVRNELRGDLRELRHELHNARVELRGDIRAGDDLMRALDDRIRMQEQSTARLEGLLEGLRETVAVRAGPWSAPADPPCTFAQCCRRRYFAQTERS